VTKAITEKEAKFAAATRLAIEGNEDQRTADLKDAGEKIKDALRPRGRRQQR
jgi:uncharacterized protein YjbJ (UPF0337 family)